MPSMQLPLTQSVPAMQVLPLTHLGQVGPPQSMSVSLPFLTVSVQVGGWHTPPAHTPLGQATLHPPQLAGLVTVEVSHPLVSLLPSQSAKPASQVPPQVVPT